ncbi:MAG: hypothetical protein ACTSPB_19540 [Candidatus Thorarchaeota archaeon]
MNSNKLITPKDRVIYDLFHNLVGELLSNIDITISEHDGDSDGDTRYTKKSVLKKTYEKNIYATRNKMFAMDIDVLVSDGNGMKALARKLNKLATMAIDDVDAREAFLEVQDECIMRYNDELCEKIKELQ